MAEITPWERRIGRQRDWMWRGWQIRYSYLHPIVTPQTAKPPLIFLHGFGAAIEQWRHNIPVLAQDYSIYALDLLGFGGSSKAAANYSAYLWAEQVYDFWQTFIRQPVVLVGNSIGSLVGLTAAATYPEMVAGLAMLSLPDISLRQEALPKRLQPLVTTLENLFASPVLLRGLFQVLRRPSIIRRWAAIAYEDKSALTDELIEILLAPAYDEGAARTFCLLFENVRKPKFAPPARAILPNLTIPMLLVWGLRDRMVPPSLAPILAGLNPLITLVELDGAGHCPHDECPDYFNSILLDWLTLVRVC